MADKHIRVKHKITGHVAGIPSKALARFEKKGWEPADGPVPDGPKVAVRPDGKKD